MEESSTVSQRRCQAKYRRPKHEFHYICGEVVVKGSKYCEKHHYIAEKLKEDEKDKFIIDFFILPPEIVGLIIEYSRASNVLKAVNSKFRKIIKHLNIVDQSGWYGAAQMNSYSLSMFLMVRKAPIELYIAISSKNESLMKYRKKGEALFAYWEISTSNFNNNCFNYRRNFETSFPATMRFYLDRSRKNLLNIKKTSYLGCRFGFNKLIENSVRKLNFDLADRMIKHHFNVVPNDRMMSLIDAFYYPMFFTRRVMPIVEFLYKNPNNFKDEDEKIAFTKKMIIKLRKPKEQRHFLECLSKCDSKLFELLNTFVHSSVMEEIDNDEPEDESEPVEDDD